jgi:phage tail sheath gpL-like
MAALTGDTQRRRKGQITVQVYPVAANAVIHYNAIVALDASGYLVPAADTAGLDVVGIADEPANNTGGANGALDVRVYRGAALIATTGASKLVQADVGGLTVTITQTVPGVGASDPTTALDATLAQDFDAIALPNNTSVDVTMAANHLEEAWDAGTKRWRRIWFGENGSSRAPAGKRARPARRGARVRRPGRRSRGAW